MKLQASLHCTLCQFRKWIHVHAFAETRTYEVSLTLLSSSSIFQLFIKSYLFHLLSCAFFAEGRGVDIISFVIFTPLFFFLTNIIALNVVSLCCRVKWISSIIPISLPLLSFPPTPHPSPIGHSRVPSRNSFAIQQLPISYLFSPW